jgi:hypothetical protein
MDRYPRVSSRLTPATFLKVDMLACLRSGTHGQVVRMAIKFYFAAIIRPTDTTDAC